MLFSNEIPAALSRLQQVVDGVRDRSTAYKIRTSSSRSLCPSEYESSWMSAKMLERYSHTRDQAKREAVGKHPRRRPGQGLHKIPHRPDLQRSQEFLSD